MFERGIKSELSFSSFSSALSFHVRKEMRGCNILRLWLSQSFNTFFNCKLGGQWLLLGAISFATSAESVCPIFQQCANKGNFSSKRERERGPAGRRDSAIRSGAVPLYSLEYSIQSIHLLYPTWLWKSDPSRSCYSSWNARKSKSPPENFLLFCVTHLKLKNVNPCGTLWQERRKRCMLVEVTRPSLHTSHSLLTIQDP